jgi:hypothetical protein
MICRPLRIGTRWSTRLALAVCAAWMLFVLATYYLGHYGPAGVISEIRHGGRASLDVFGGLPANLRSLLEAGLFFGVAYGIGGLLLALTGLRFHNPSEAIAYRTGIGLGFQALLTLALGAAGLLFPALFWLLWLVGAIGLIILATWRGIGRLRDGGRLRRPSLPKVDWLIVAAAALVAYLLYSGFLIAGSPEQTRDAVEYHLAAPRLYVDAHQIFNLLPRYGIWRAEPPSNQEMLYTAGLLLDPSWATLSRLLHTGEGALLVLAMAGFSGWLVGSARPGWIAGAAFLATPTVTFELGWGLNDVAVTLFAVLCIAALARWSALHLRGEPAWRWLGLAGAFGGLTYGFKPTAVFVVIAAGLLATVIAAWHTWRARGPTGSIRHALTAVLAYGAPAIILTLPWLAKAAINTGDPVYPILYSLFHSPWWSAAADWSNLQQLRSAYGAGHGAGAVLRSLWNLTFLSERFDGVVGPIFLMLAPLVPLLCWANRRSLGQRVVPILALWTTGLGAYLFWALTISEARFAFPSLALMLLAATCAAFAAGPHLSSWVSSGTMAFILVLAGLNSPGFRFWQAPTPPSEVLYWPSTDLRASFGKETLDQFFIRNGGDYWYPWSVIAYINQHLATPTTRILTAGPPILPYYYLDPAITLDSTNDALIRREPHIDLASPEALDRLRTAGVTHLYVSRSVYDQITANPALADHLYVLVMTPGPGNDIEDTPMRLLAISS